MHRTIIILVLIAVCIDLNGQRNMVDSLVYLESKVYQSKSRREKLPYLVAKFQLYLDQQEYSESGMREAQRIDGTLLDSAQAVAFYWNVALYSYIVKDFKNSKVNLQLYRDVRNEKTTEEILLSYLTEVHLDSTKAQAYLKELLVVDTTFECLECIEETMDFTGKNARPYVISSAIVPGSGMMLNGNIGKGLVSMGIHSGIVIAVVAMLRMNVMVNAIAWGLALTQKFYLGNLKLTRKLVEKSNKSVKNRLGQECERDLEVVLSAYPMGFK